MKIYKNVWIILAVICFQAGMGVIPLAAEPPTPDSVIIENDGYQPDRKGPVEFTHAHHAYKYEIACKACHHEYDDGINTWEEDDPVTACNECHDTTSDDPSVPRLKMAYHKNCQACHKEMAIRKRMEAPYNKCNACHARKGALN